MPIFEYECSNCRRRFEVLVSGSRRTRTKCPYCKSRKVIRLLSSFGIGGTSSEGSSKASSACTTCSSRNCASCG